MTTREILGYKIEKLDERYQLTKDFFFHLPEIHLFKDINSMFAFLRTKQLLSDIQELSKQDCRKIKKLCKELHNEQTN